jgi:hypothetical protein
MRGKKEERADEINDKRKLKRYISKGNGLRKKINKICEKQTMGRNTTELEVRIMIKKAKQMKCGQLETNENTALGLQTRGGS